MRAWTPIFALRSYVSYYPATSKHQKLRHLQHPIHQRDHIFRISASVYASCGSEGCGGPAGIVRPARGQLWRRAATRAWYGCTTSAGFSGANPILSLRPLCLLRRAIHGLIDVCSVEVNVARNTICTRLRPETQLLAWPLEDRFGSRYQDLKGIAVLHPTDWSHQRRFRPRTQSIKWSCLGTPKRFNINCGPRYLPREPIG